MLPDLGKADDFDMSSESFKHRFLNANRSWIIEQLRGALGHDGNHAAVLESLFACMCLFGTQNNKN